MKVYAANNSDYDVRSRSSAGGVFSLLAEKILSEGGVVYGASFDETWNVVHKRVIHPEELDRLRRSKYVFSNLGSSLSDLKKDLEEGKKVMFCSVPCQIAALRKFVGSPSNLLLVEVVCHGAPIAEYWLNYLQELCSKKNKILSDIESINFRDKSTGWKNYSFSVKFKDGTLFTQPHYQNLYLRAFIKGFLLREPCFNCKYKYPIGSKADLTLGDFWGISKIAPSIDNDNGTTIVIPNSNKGNKICKLLKFNFEVPYVDVIKYNPAISFPPIKPKNFKCFKEMVNRKRFLKVLNKFAGLTIKEKIVLLKSKFK